MYSPAQLWMDFPALSPISTSLAKRDDWVENVAKFCAAAGWSIRVSGASFTVNTLDQTMLSYIAFGGGPDSPNNIFWRIVRNDNGKSIHVIDGPHPTAGKPPGIVIETGSDSAVATHAGVVQAIMILLADKGPTPTALGSLSTRMTTNSPRNDFSVNLSIGSSLRSSTSDTQAYAGYVCTSQPSRKTYLKGAQIKTAGDQNYISFYITSKVEGGGNLDNNMVHVAGAKNFLPFAVDTPGLVGEQSALAFGRTSGVGTGQKGLERMGQLDTFRTIGFANPHQLILHVETGDNRVAFIHAGALKLLDFRTSGADDLPVTAANLFTASRGATGPFRSFRQFGGVEGNVVRVEVNDKAFFGTGVGFVRPDLVLYQTMGNRDASKFGCLWAGDIGEVCEPWILMTPRASGTAFVAGQLWDAMTIYERTPSPTMSRFPWDGQRWIRYTKDAQTIAAGEVPFTLCLRATQKFNPPH